MPQQTISLCIVYARVRACVSVLMCVCICLCVCACTCMCAGSFHNNTTIFSSQTCIHVISLFVWGTLPQPGRNVWNHTNARSKSRHYSTYWHAHQRPELHHSVQDGRLQGYSGFAFLCFPSWLPCHLIILLQNVNAHPARASIQARCAWKFITITVMSENWNENCNYATILNSI